MLGSALLNKLSVVANVIVRTRGELDLTNQADVESFFKKEKPEYVFLAAGLTGGIVANTAYPATFFHANIAIQDNVFEAVRKYAVKKLVFYGSSCIYPKSCPQPIKEEYLLKGELEGTSEAYATAKIAGVLSCKAYNKEFKKNRFVALIPNSMYGRGDNFDLKNSHVLAALIRKFCDAKMEGKDKIVLWGSGNQRREFIFSEDVADASIFAIQNEGRLQNCHYNIGTGLDYSIRELSGIISGIVGFKGKIEWDKTKPVGAARKLLDSRKFSKLGWRPSTQLEDGLKITCNWYLEKKCAEQK